PVQRSSRSWVSQARVSAEPALALWPTSCCRRRPRSLAVNYLPYKYKPTCRCSSLLHANRLGLDRTDISRDVGRGCGPRRSTSQKNTPTVKYAECWTNDGRSRCALPPQPYKETSLCCLHSAHKQS
ncbi:unnamed protein product, partial [Ectocarpus sp. 6 AP-2014]